MLIKLSARLLCIYPPFKHVRLPQNPSTFKNTTAYLYFHKRTKTQHLIPIPPLPVLPSPPLPHPISVVQFQLHLNMIKNVVFTICTFPLLNTKKFSLLVYCPLCMICLCCKALGKTRYYLVFEGNGCSLLAGKEFLLYLLSLLCKLSFLPW